MEDLESQWTVVQRELQKQRVVGDAASFVFEGVSSSVTARVEGIIQETSLEESTALSDPLSEVFVQYVAGLDISYSTVHEGMAVAAVVVLEFSTLKIGNHFDQIVYSHTIHSRVMTPYLSGFLAFREVPLLISVLKAVPAAFRPQIIMCDGNGVLHQRRFGEACHIGVLSGIPCLGVAKTYYNMGTNFPKDLNGKGYYPIWIEGELLGVALLPKPQLKKPIFISVGSGLSLRSALIVTLHCSLYRIPEPTRQADLISRQELRRLDAQSDRGREEGEKTKDVTETTEEKDAKE